MANFLDDVNYNVKMFSKTLMMHLRAALPAAGYVNRAFDGATGGVGDTVYVPRVVFSGTARTRAREGAVVFDDIGASRVAITLQEIYSAVSVDQLDLGFSNVDLQGAQAKEIASALVTGVDSLVVGQWNNIPWETGEVDGTAAFNATDKLLHLSAARKILSVNKAPMNNLIGILGPTEAHNFRILAENFKVNESGTDAVRREGALGKVYGINLFESQNIESSTLTTAAIWDAPAAVDTNAARGATAIHVDGLGAGSIAAGSTFTLGGYKYVVTTTTAIVANEVAALPISPPLLAAVVDGDVLTPIAHSAAGSENIIMDPRAIGLAIRPSAPLIGGGVSMVETDAETGISFRVDIQSIIGGVGAGTDAHQMMKVSLLGGAAVVDERLAVRLTGQV